MDGSSPLQLIEEMKKKVSDNCSYDYHISYGYLDRWIRYQGLNIDAAVVAYNSSMKWRAENDILGLRNEDYKDLEVRFPVFLDPTPDKYGRPVVRVSMQNWDSKHMPFGESHNKYYVRGCLKFSEQLEQWIEQHLENSNGKIAQCVVVMDCTKLADHMKNVGLKKSYTVAFLVKEIISALSINYPRLFGAIFVLNASKWFKFLLSVAKPFMSKDTLNVLQVHGSGSEFDWRSLIY